MKNITLTSDYGNASHYAAAVKGNLYKSIANIQVVDVSHNIDKFNKLQAAFVLKGIYKNFANDTIHLICVDTNIFVYQSIVVFFFDNQYFVCLDNGILNLMFGNQQGDIWIVKNQFYDNNSLFIENNAFVSVANHLALGLPIEQIAKKGDLNSQLVHANVQVDKDEILASVVFIDGFGNAFINVDETLFNKVCNGRKFKIHYARREYFERIFKHYKEVKIGTEAILFNSDGYLEIATNEGNAAQLLGLRVGSKIIIEFY